MESKTLNCRSKWAYRLKITSYLMLIGGLVSFLYTFYMGCLNFSASQEFKFNYLPLIYSIPIFVQSVFYACIGFCLSAITQNSEQKKVYLRHKAKNEGILFQEEKPI